MRSTALQDVLERFIEEAATLLHAEVSAGAEVPFEIEPRRGSRGSRGAALYCYRPLTGRFIQQRHGDLQKLSSHAKAVRALEEFPSLDRYLEGAGIEPGRADTESRARRALSVLLEDAFGEQTDFELRAERTRAALERLKSCSLSQSSEFTLVASLLGVQIGSEQLALAKGLAIARPDALSGLPDALGAGEYEEPCLAVVLSGEEEQPREAIARGAAALRELLRALRLFGDGRVTLGRLAFSRVGAGAWCPIALSSGGRPHGVLLVTPDQEDELRAFCNLVSRRAPEGDEIAWALERFELGCERASAYTALTDYALSLRALLEPEGPSSGLLPGRLAALCATPATRTRLAERTAQALELERAVVAGSAVEHAGGCALVEELAGNLRALLRDVICGHLAPDLTALADEILLTPPEGSGEQVLGDAPEPDEVLDLLV
jgi:hypothetical protein